ncbi:uncharacterized protein EAF02_005953 [Botrytis sinoallii]|uniref:uncharacterized protein n=1 Tax=Botrytis sinoallii TaxID=1463999 RepID=UPI00190211D5|nr:uncharacterized protein EAF02_005953 [Botrytis sinoallii]KAF7882590.1 hypothetical protein EAF02_005953 [Botrytis sinoallii]
MMFWTAPIQLAIQQSNSDVGDVAGSCQKSHSIIITVRNRDSSPLKEEEHRHSHNHTPTFYVKEGEAKSDSIRQKIEQHYRAHITLVEGDAERSCKPHIGSTAFLSTENSHRCLRAITINTPSLVGSAAFLPTENLQMCLRATPINMLPIRNTPPLMGSIAFLPTKNSLQYSCADLMRIRFWDYKLCRRQVEGNNLSSFACGATEHRLADKEVSMRDNLIYAEFDVDIVKQQIVRSYRNPALQSNHRKNRICINICAVPGMVISSYALSRYIVQTSLPTTTKTMLHRNLTGFPTINHPSSTTFVAALLIYAICSMSMYRANSHHFYQQHTIFLFTIGVVIFQLFQYPSLNEALGMAAAVIPAGVTIAMVVSMIGHFWSPSHEETAFQDLIKNIEKMVREGEIL